jgi:hypothetical protein
VIASRRQIPQWRSAIRRQTAISPPGSDHRRDDLAGVDLEDAVGTVGPTAHVPADRR